MLFGGGVFYQEEIKASLNKNPSPWGFSLQSPVSEGPLLEYTSANRKENRFLHIFTYQLSPGQNVPFFFEIISICFPKLGKRGYPSSKCPNSLCTKPQTASSLTVVPEHITINPIGYNRRYLLRTLCLA